MDQKNDICDFSDTLNKKCKDFPPFLENQIIYGRVISIYDGSIDKLCLSTDTFSKNRRFFRERRHNYSIS